MNFVIDDGVQFGLGVFETICLRDGMPELLDWHLERLNASLLVLGVNQKVTEAEVLNWLSQESTRETIPALHAMKIMVSEKNKMMAFRGNPYSEERKEKGFRLEYSPILRNETSPLVYHKTMNYGDNIMEKRRAVKEGFDEVLFLNSRGEICEGSTTNVFFKRDGKLYTPPVDVGLLPGVMRRLVMANYDVEEKVLYPEDMECMDSCFVTNSLMGMMKVVQLAEKKFL